LSFPVWSTNTRPQWTSIASRAWRLNPRIRDCGEFWSACAATRFRAGGATAHSEGLSLSENKTLGVHLPREMDEAVLDSCVVFMPLFLLRKLLCKITALIYLSRLCFAVSTVTACQFLRSKRNSEHVCTYSNLAPFRTMRTMRGVIRARLQPSQSRAALPRPRQSRWLAPRARRSVRAVRQ
jgi:hypothetical protein